MTDLSTTYLGWKLKNPIVASASPLQKEITNLRRYEDAGASAIVLHSLFEEQIVRETENLNEWLDYGTESYAESLRYLPELEPRHLHPDAYLEHIRKAKAAVAVPVIASLNGVTPGGWTRYAKAMQDAGAEAIELNMYQVTANPEVDGATVEQRYCDLVQQVKNTVSIPLAVKVGHFFSSIPNMLVKLDRAGADALVVFNRFYQPDFDLEALEVVPSLNLSHSVELLLRLNWVAIVYGHVKADIAVTGGVHTAKDVVKSMMAGANVAMMTSAVLELGIDHIRNVLVDLSEWMEEHEYDSIEQMRGSMSRRAVPDPGAFERANYMRVLSSYLWKTVAR